MKEYTRITKEIEQKIIEMRKKGIKYECIAYDLNVSVGSAHKIFKRYEKNSRKTNNMD